MKLYEDICGYFEKAVNLRIGKNMQDGFSPIFLLDIYLNAFLKYASGFKKAEKNGDTARWKAYNRDNLRKKWQDSLRDTLEYTIALLFEPASFDSSSEEIDTIRLNKITNALAIITSTEISRVIARLKKEKKIAFLTLEGLQKWNDGSGDDGQLHNDYLMITDTGERRGHAAPGKDEESENQKVPDEYVHHAQEVIQLFDQEENRALLDQQQPSLSAASCAEMRLRNRWIAYTHHMPFVSKQRIGLDEKQWKTLYDDACDAVRLAANAKMPYSFALFVQYMYCILTGKTESDKDKEVSDIKERLRKTGPRRKVDYVILCCPPKDGKEPTSWPVNCKDPERGFIQNKECVFARYSHPVSQTTNDWIRIKQRLTILNIKEKNSIQEKAEIRFRLDGPVLDVITYQG